MRFRRVDRLTRKAEFDLVLTQATVRLTSGPFRLFGLPRDTCSSQGARLGLIVGGRQLRRAVDRNAVKRRVRESFRLCRDGLPALDIVVRLSRQPESGLDLTAAATEMWRKLKRATTTQAPETKAGPA